MGSRQGTLSTIPLPRRDLSRCIQFLVMDSSGRGNDGSWHVSSFAARPLVGKGLVCVTVQRCEMGCRPKARSR